MASAGAGLKACSIDRREDNDRIALVEFSDSFLYGAADGDEVGNALGSGKIPAAEQSD